MLSIYELPISPKNRYVLSGHKGYIKVLEIAKGSSTGAILLQLLPQN